VVLQRPAVNLPPLEELASAGLDFREKCKKKSKSGIRVKKIDALGDSGI
jgi:hypothetical protein